ncbi:phosphate metabolism protein 7 [Mycoemilia scoparia]|uniref:Phosphate metabolism protein 7 n=1 Tax=Mycoemilia scoparia TaxID=417184 RepID=A0A9W8DUT4_9FUNG|nr:phosphate metabolism protein 7 [Mycoemilia scoparia]
MGELNIYVLLRRKYLRRKEHREDAKSRTIMINSIPEFLMDKMQLEKLFSAFPGGVKAVYLHRDVSEIEKVIKERAELQKKAEKVFTDYAIQCDKYYRSIDKQDAKADVHILDQTTTNDSVSNCSKKYNQSKEHISLNIAELATGSPPGKNSKAKKVKSKYSLPSDQKAIDDLEPILKEIHELNKDFKTLKKQFELTKKSEWAEYWKSRIEDMDSEIEQIKDDMDQLDREIDILKSVGLKGLKKNERQHFKSLLTRKEQDEQLIKKYETEKEKCISICFGKLDPNESIKQDEVESEVGFSQGCKQSIRMSWDLISRRFAKKEKKPGDAFKKKRAAFIQFHSQISAHMAAQTLIHGQTFAMEPKVLEIDYDDIVWENLSIWSWSRNIRFAISIVISVILCIGWTTITVFVTSIASIENIQKALGDNNKNILKSLPSNLVSVIQGVVPALLTSLLMKMLPEILKKLVKFEGKTLKSEIELALMDRYYTYLVINVFFGAVVSSSFFSFISQLNTTEAWTKLLNTLIPGAYVYFATYVLLEGWSGSAQELFQKKPLIFRHLKPLLSSDTPRSRKAAIEMSGFKWGTEIPKHTLIFLIGTTYSGFAPIINVLVTSYFGLFYIAYRYQFFYVYDESKFSTGGLSFPKSVVQMYFGIYIFEAVFLVQMISSSKGDVGSIIRLVLTVIIIAGTIVANVITVKAYFPLIKYLPISTFKLDVSQDDYFLESQAKRLFKSGIRKIKRTNKEILGTRKGSKEYGNISDKEDDEETLLDRGNAGSMDDDKSTLSRELENDVRDGYYHPSLKEETTLKLWVPRDNHNSCEKLYQLIPGIREYDIELNAEGAYLNKKSRVKLDEEPGSLFKEIHLPKFSIRNKKGRVGPTTNQPGNSFEDSNYSLGSSSVSTFFSTSKSIQSNITQSSQHNLPNHH